MFGQLPGHSIRAWVLEIDGKPVGMAGHHLVGGEFTVFSHVEDGVPKLTIWRQAKAFMSTIKVKCYCRSTDTSGPFLERLGWSRIADDGECGIYRYDPQEVAQ